MKALKIYLIASLLVLLASVSMYWNGKESVETKVLESKDKRILELERDLAACLENNNDIDDCKDIVKEINIWKELAESCVSEKTEVKNNKR